MSSRVSCKECGTSWVDQEAYKRNPGCNRSYCKHNYTPLVETPKFQKPTQATMHTHRVQHQVLSTYDATVAFETLVVPDAIYTNIFPR